MIDTIIFDIGRVLLRFEWPEYLSGFSFDDKTYDAVARVVFASPNWNEFDRSAVTDQEVLSLFIREAPEYENEIRMVFENFPSCLKMFPYTLPWLTNLKERGYRLFYLSNYAKTTREKSASELRFLDLMDGGLMSYEIHEVKPDPAIFQALFSRYSIDPKHAVFIDDSPVNRDAARKLGLHTVLFEDYATASEKLDTLLAEFDKPYRLG